MTMSTRACSWVLLPLLAAAGAAQAPQPTQPALPLAKPKEAAATKPVYDEAADAKQDVAAAVARAARDNRRVLIQWGANWCGWCKWLAGTMQRDPKLSRELLYEYEVVHVDVGRFDKNKDLAKELGADFQAIPFLTILGADGKALVQQNTEPFEAKIDGKDGHDPAKLLAFLKEHEATALDAAKVRDAALAQAKAGHKRLFLHFGAPWCGWCHKLENWMAQPEVAALLAKDFVDCKIDNDRMTGGKDVYEQELERTGQKDGGIPWFVFCDGDGKVLATSNMPDGADIGFPYQVAEVEAFVAMLQKAKVNLTDADVSALADSLHAIRKADAAKKAEAGH